MLHIQLSTGVFLRRFPSLRLFSSLLLVAGLGGCSHVKGPVMPSFNLLLVDSATVFSSIDIPGGRPIVLIYFSPDCEHCQSETAGLLSKMDSLREVRFYFITTDPFERLKVFRDYYHLNRFPNITLGKDYNLSFMKELKPTGTPYLLIYNSQRKLYAVCNGETPADKIISLTKNN